MTKKDPKVVELQAIISETAASLEAMEATIDQLDDLRAALPAIKGLLRAATKNLRGGL